MIVVSDTSSILYLLLLDQLELLPRLYDQVIIPQIVQTEMTATEAPPKLRQWIAAPPVWLTRVSASQTLLTQQFWGSSKT